MREAGLADEAGAVGAQLKERHDRFTNRVERYREVSRARKESANEVLRKDQRRGQERYAEAMEE